MGRRRTTTVLIAVGGLLIGMALSSCAGDEPSREPADMVPVLSVEQSQSDRLPDARSEVQFDLQADTVRLLRETADETHWVALNDAGSICLVTSLAGTQAFGASCSPPDAFFERGASILTSVEGRSGSTGLLVPADVDLTSLGLSETATAGDSTTQLLALTRDEVRSLSGAEVPRETGGTFTLYVH